MISKEKKAKTQYVTGIFKVHNLSQRKRCAIDYVMEQYSRLVLDLLHWARERHDDLMFYSSIAKEKDGVVSYSWAEQSVLKEMPACKNIEADISGELIDSAIKDVARMLASYFSLVYIYKTTGGEKDDAPPGFPSSSDPDAHAYEDALAMFCDLDRGWELYDEDKNRYLKQSRSSVRPLLFTRQRECPLIGRQDGDDLKLFAMPFVLPPKHELGWVNNIHDGGLTNWSTGEVVKLKSDKIILMPLQVGQRNGEWGWQYDRFVRPLIDGLAKVKECKLVREDRASGQHDYFLHVSFAFEVPEPYEEETIMGVDRGMIHRLAYGLVRKEDGTILDMWADDEGFQALQKKRRKFVAKKQARGRRITINDYRGKALTSILHSSLNILMDVAEANRAVIVLEDLNVNVKGKYTASNWKKIEELLTYKCKLRGIPLRKKMWAAYSSKICIVCGEINKGRRLGKPFVCPNCGAEYHSDAGAGINLARRYLYKKAQWENKGGWTAFHRSFANRPVQVTGISLRQNAAAKHTKSSGNVVGCND